MDADGIDHKVAKQNIKKMAIRSGDELAGTWQGQIVNETMSMQLRMKEESSTTLDA